MRDVEAFYDLIDEESRFSRNSRKIEFLTTTRILDEFLVSNGTIADIGAGAGAYSFHYASIGYEVTALDLSYKHIDRIQARSRDSGLPVEASVGNAVDLSRFASNSFDAVLCLGPMYHLTEEEDRKRCISECLRIVKPGGILAVAYINKFSVLPMLTTRDNAFIRSSVVEKVIQQGVIRSGDTDCFWTDAFFTSPEELEYFMSNYPIKIVDHAATDGISHTIQEYIDALDTKQFESWLQYHYETCREKSILGMSTHGLYVGRKAT